MKPRKERSDEDGRCYLPNLEEIELMKRLIREENERGAKRVYKAGNDFGPVEKRLR